MTTLPHPSQSLPFPQLYRFLPLLQGFPQSYHLPPPLTFPTPFSIFINIILYRSLNTLLFLDVQTTPFLLAFLIFFPSLPIYLPFRYFYQFSFHPFHTTFHFVIFINFLSIPSNLPSISLFFSIFFPSLPIYLPFRYFSQFSFHPFQSTFHIVILLKPQPSP